MVRFSFALVLMSCALTALADDSRERRAKVALALAKPAGVALAPEPRPAPRTYERGYAAATANQEPLVVFVKCQPVPVEGAIVSKVDALGDVTGPAVVVLYPVGAKLYVDATLPPDQPAKVKDAVKSAAKKIDAPAATDRPAPKPLSWAF